MTRTPTSETDAQRKPTVSIGMPVYNGAAHLAEAIDSVLAQTFPDFELIICDNASTDSTESICRSYAERDDRVRYFRNEVNAGAAANYNRTFELASAEYFKWFAHDDILGPTYLECCVNTLDECDASVVLCFAQRIIMTNDGRVLGPDKRRRWFEANWPFDRIGFVRSLFIPDRSFPELVFGLVRSSTLRRTRLIGAYNLADLVLVTELRIQGEFRHLLEPLFFNRGHNETADFKKARRTARGEAEWYDPRRHRRVYLPEVTLLFERLKGVWQTDIALTRKLWWCGWVVVAHVVMRTLSRIAPRLEAVRAWMWRRWSVWTVAAVSGPTNRLSFHRLWMLVAGLRHFNRVYLRIAFANSSEQSHADLILFVAQRLAKRQNADKNAERVLREWLHGDCKLRRKAAATVMDQSSLGGVVRQNYS